MASLFWLRDKRLENANGLLPADMLITSVIKDLQFVIEQLASINEDVSNGVPLNDQ